jgi:hypothetical protein
MKRANRFGPPAELMVSNQCAKPINSPHVCQQTRGDAACQRKPAILAMPQTG